MYIHTLACLCESQRCFFSLLSLKYISYLFFCLSVLCLLPPCCRVFRGLSCRLSSLLLSPFVPIWRTLEALRRPSVCRAACLLLVSYQAQNAVAVWADAARICPRPYVLLPMCCRCLFRCPFRGFRPSVRVCVLLPCVLWW